ncbi:glycosyltransferase family 2 protein [Candidatus Saccharibacteria bacterium CPR2]|nr:glycosyltransferase family 2 protein [Candidatus Saccharibacteria bacterium CPR2]
MQEITFYTFLIIGFIYFSHIAIFCIGGNIYDIVQTLNKNKLKNSRYKKYHPQVSVLIPAYNEELVIERCLESVIKSQHRKLQIIAINDNSSDNTAQIVREFIRNNSKKNIRLISRRKNQGKAMGLNYALKKYATGELIMTLDADSILEKRTISNAVKYFINNNIHGIAANVRILPSRGSFLNLLQLFEYLVSYRTKKFYSLTNSEFIIGGVGSVYRKDTMKNFGYYDDSSATEDIGLSMKIASSGTKSMKLKYASNVIAFTESVSTIPQLLKQRYRWKYGNLQNLFKYSSKFIANRKNQSKVMLFYRLPMSYLSEILLLLEPFLLSYAFYLSYKSGTISVFVSAYILLSVYSAFVLWSDEYLSVANKRKLSLAVPALYFLFYIMSFIQIAAAIKCLGKIPSIATSNSSNNTWISPKRLGAKILLR